MRGVYRSMLIGVLVIAAACGGSSHGSSAATATSSDPRSQTRIEADKAAAQNALLKLSDFPTGWTSKPASNPTANADLDKQLAACVGADVTNQSNPTHVASDDFSDPNGSNTASNSVGLAASADASNAAMDKFSGPKVPGCLAQAMDTAIAQNTQSSGTTLPKGVTIGKADAATESFPNVADRTTALRVTVPVQANGLNLKIFADFIAFTKGRSSSVLDLQGQGSPFPADMATSLAQTIAGRLPST
jgi:hypothetical protein